MGAPVTNHIRLLDAFPNVRLENRSTTRLPDNSQKETSVIRCISGGRLLHLDSGHQVAQIKSSADVASLWIIPMHALGRRLRGSVNVSLDHLMGSPGVAKVEGVETIGETEAVRLQIGPPLPEALRPFGEDADFFGRVWLAPKLDWLPIRTEWFDRDDAGDVKISGSDGVELAYTVNRYELEQIEAVPDEARDTSVFFPRRIKFTDAGGVRTCTLDRIRINPVVKPSDFEITVPDGFRVAEDGAIPVVHLSGGGAALNKQLEDNSSTAKALLPERRTFSVQMLMLINVLIVCIGALALFLWKRRVKP